MNTCKLCGKSFPFRVVINNKIVITNRRKYCFECSPFGKHNTKKLTVPASDLSQLKSCGKCGKFADKYETSHSYCKSCSKDCTLKRQRDNKNDYINYKGGKCEMCGYSKCPAALQFHHKDPTKKDFGIAQHKNVKINNKIRNELDKCLLLCANCHAEKHYLG